MDTPTQILVASSELENRRALAGILTKEGYDTICVSRVSECQEALSAQNVTLVFCDRRLSDGTYRDVLGLARGSKQNVRVVVTSRLAD
jgi:DNA-binding NtrC family response regulator